MKKQSKKDRAIELTFNIVQNMKYADKNRHLKYAYNAQISGDEQELTKLVGKKKAMKMIKEHYESWIN